MRVCPAQAPDNPRDILATTSKTKKVLHSPVRGPGALPPELVEQACRREHDPGVERGKTAKQQEVP